MLDPGNKHKTFCKIKHPFSRAVFFNGTFHNYGNVLLCHTIHFPLIMCVLSTQNVAYMIEYMNC